MDCALVVRVNAGVSGGGKRQWDCFTVREEDGFDDFDLPCIDSRFVFQIGPKCSRWMSTAFFRHGYLAISEFPEQASGSKVVVDHEQRHVNSKTVILYPGPNLRRFLSQPFVSNS